MDKFEGLVQLSIIIAFLREDINKKLFGDVLTILDLVISDPISRKAAKSLVSQSFTRRTTAFLAELNKVKQEDLYKGTKGG